MGKNKLILLIKIIGETRLKIEILYLDKRFLTYIDPDNSSDDKFVYFVSSDDDFCIYSQGEGYIIDECQYCLVLPDKKNMKYGHIIEHNFKSDNKRYNFLKQLYEHIPEWGNYWSEFINDDVPEHNVIVNNNYWIY